MPDNILSRAVEQCSQVCCCCQPNDSQSSGVAESDQFFSTPHSSPFMSSLFRRENPSEPLLQEGDSLDRSTFSFERKLVVLGARSSGKSALCQRFVGTAFSNSYVPTIESTYQGQVQIQNIRFDCEVLDTAGQNKQVTNIPRQAAVGAHGYLFVYSIADYDSFQCIPVIHDKLKELVGSPIHGVLVGCKSDLDGSCRRVSERSAQTLADSLGMPFTECSAKNDTGINHVFQLVICELEAGNSVLVPKSESAKCEIV